MKLYVCWGTFQTIRPGGHPCHNAYQAVRMAGHDPEVIKVRGLGIGPRFMHLMTRGRKEVEELTGQRAVPVLVTEGGEVITDSHRIVDWAERNPAPCPPANADSHTYMSRSLQVSDESCRVPRDR